MQRTAHMTGRPFAIQLRGDRRRIRVGLDHRAQGVVNRVDGRQIALGNAGSRARARGHFVLKLGDRHFAEFSCHNVMATFHRLAP